MMIPQINLNGTNGRTLMEEYLDAMARLQVAITALQGVTVHGRDYHMQGGLAINKAVDEHRARIRKLMDVEAELEAIAIDINRQINP